MNYTGLNLPTEITVRFTFSVSDEAAIRDRARDILKDPVFDGSLDADTSPLDELVDLIIAESVGGWLNIGLERVND